MVNPGMPRHVTQRGDRRERMFFEEDYAACLEAVAEWCLSGGLCEEGLREHGRTDGAMSNPAFARSLEYTVGSVLRPQKAGRPRKLPSLPK